MDHHRIHLEQHFAPNTFAPALASFISLALGVYILAYLFDYSLLSPQELLWHSLVYILPAPLLLDQARRQELQANKMLSQTHAAKCEALRKLMGIGNNAVILRLPASGSLGRRNSTSVEGGKISDVPAGLGNWDNSCYQNSVLQALSSLGSLRAWLGTLGPPDAEGNTTTNKSLQEMILKLRDSRNNGKHIWTPAKLKSMSSWQQQDAQEYFSKIMDELDKEARASFLSREKMQGLETLLEPQLRLGAGEAGDKTETTSDLPPRNPLEGLVAQRVACTSCGFSEGFSMIQFNCLTVPLGSDFFYDLEECLDEYTKREEIEGVECRSCTLLQAKSKLMQLQLPPELRSQVTQRLHAIEQALENDDFSDNTLKQDCQLSPKAYVSSTKSKEALVGRAPRSLVIHLNRSVFDPMTGDQRKNYAEVRYPMVLDLRPWMLKAGNTPALYRLSAAVTHYGRHENGHYICYRRHPRTEVIADVTLTDDPLTKEYDGKENWWRLSDEDVSAESEESVLGQGGVFMLFYEQVEMDRLPAEEDIELAAAIALPPDEAADWELPSAEPSSTATTSAVTSATQSVVSDTDTEYDFDSEPATTHVLKPLAQAPALRTAAPPYVHPAQKDMKHGLGMNRSIMSV